MDAAVFWEVISQYNSQTIIAQAVLALVLVAALILSYTGKLKWGAKLVLGIALLYIGIVFFGLFGTEPIQRFFALPLYLVCGGLMIFECAHHKNDILKKPNIWHILLISLFLLYPFISYLLGHTFPGIVTYIMPCPVVTISIAVYSGYQKKNRLLLLLLTIWGLTGIKSLIFSAYEDIILLIAGIYGVYLLCGNHKKAYANP